MELPHVFHLHYHVPNVDYASSILRTHGITPAARFGSRGDESVSLSPDEPVPADFRLRLQTNRGGTADVTLTPAPRVDFDHFGVVVADVSTVVGRASDRGWSVTENERRTFLVTPWGFRVELQGTDSDVVAELGSPTDCQFSGVTLAVPVEVREHVSRTLRAVVGDVSNLRVVPVRGTSVGVREARLDGDDVETSRFEMSSLVDREAV